MRVAVIDIGSNAIRAAIYDSNHLGSAEIFNEKFKSDLSLVLLNDDNDINHGVYKIFGYFQTIFNKLQVSKIECVATEVLRNHQNANYFIEQIKKRFDIEVRIITGDDEAKITAKGLISSIPDASGIVVDLGGGSLELAEVDDKVVSKVSSLPLGTKALTKMQIEDPVYISDKIKSEFGDKKCDNLYLIGGSLRLLGRCYMDYNKSIIKNLHNLVINPDEFSNFLEELQTLRKFQSFFKQYKINKNAITVMKALLNHFNPKALIISTFGLKEGVRFDLLSEEEKQKDIVLERCLDLSKIFFTNLHPEPYCKIFRSLDITKCETRQKLFNIALILSQYSRHVDRNYRAEWIISFILSTDIPFNQMQRASLIISISEALASRPNIVPKQTKKMLSRDEIIYAQIVGSFIKIAMLIDGPFLTKPSFSINIKNKFLELSVEEKLPKNIFEKTCEMLRKISSLKNHLEY
jgi:exopolyphosphatase / guanosine-5'-triphosphate,3'-diphosphate pyrophosphatase